MLLLLPLLLHISLLPATNITLYKQHGLSRTISFDISCSCRLPDCCCSPAASARFSIQFLLLRLLLFLPTPPP
jgi:hypothetical protein